LLQQDTDGTFVCHDSQFMDFVRTVSANCDNGIDVLISSATQNPLLQVAHNIFLNHTKVTRFGPISPIGYERERGMFRITPAGSIF
jgi:hypothetical protein